MFWFFKKRKMLSVHCFKKKINSGSLFVESWDSPLNFRFLGNFKEILADIFFI